MAERVRREVSTPAGRARLQISVPGRLNNDVRNIEPRGACPRAWISHGFQLGGGGGTSTCFPPPAPETRAGFLGLIRAQLQSVWAQRCLDPVPCWFLLLSGHDSPPKEATASEPGDGPLGVR